ncbi:IDH3G-like protein, partial [Mya arenaria]
MAASMRRLVQQPKLLTINLRTLTRFQERSVTTTGSTSRERFSKYGGRNTVTVMTGDGVGPELLKHVQEVYAGAPVNFEEVEIDASQTDESFLNDAVLSETSQQIMTVINDLELFASIVKCKSMPGVATRHGNIDMVLIRENTEGEKLGDGLFLNCCREVSKLYPTIEFNDMIIDNASMQVILCNDVLYLN